MPRIRIARSIGFCSGVKRAIDMAERVLAERRGRVYSLGPVIHNREVIGSLKAQGLFPVRTLAQVPRGSCVILPSHGSRQSVLAAARKKKLRLIDVTCPHVSRVQKICRKLSQEGLSVLIIGDKHHPEVRALLELAPRARVISSIADIQKDRYSFRRVGVISQTTQSKQEFCGLVAALIEKNQDFKELHAYNTICLDTAQRQEEVKRLAEAVDVMLVIGSATSANTKRLLHRARESNPRAFLVENESTALGPRLKGARSVGIISGASAPQWLVDRIVGKVRLCS